MERRWYSLGKTDANCRLHKHPKFLHDLVWNNKLITAPVAWQNIAQTRQEAELRGHTESVMYMRWHPTHPDKLASISQQEKNVRFWDHRNGKNSPTATLDTPGQNLYLAWTNNGNYLAVGNKDDGTSWIYVFNIDMQVATSIYKLTN